MATDTIFLVTSTECTYQSFTFDYRTVVLFTLELWDAPVFINDLTAFVLVLVAGAS